MNRIEFPSLIGFLILLNVGISFGFSLIYCFTDAPEDLIVAAVNFICTTINVTLWRHELFCAPTEVAA